MYNPTRDGFRPIFRPAGPSDTKELTAFLCADRLGRILQAWSRNEAHHELVGVMMATIFGAADGLTEVMGGGAPEYVYLESPRLQYMMLRLPDGRMCIGSAGLGLAKRTHRAALRRSVDALDALDPRPVHARPVEGVERTPVRAR